MAGNAYELEMALDELKRLDALGDVAAATAQAEKVRALQSKVAEENKAINSAKNEARLADISQSPGAYGIVGGTAGLLAGKALPAAVDALTPAPYKAVQPGTPAPVTAPPAAPAAAPAVPSAPTQAGFHPGAVSNAQFNAQQIQANQLHKPGNIPAGFQVTDNSRIITPTTLNTPVAPAAAPVVPPAVQQPKLSMPAVKATLQNTARGFENQPPAPPVGRYGRFYGAGMATGLAKDAEEQLRQGNVGQAAISGVGSVGALASLSSNPKLRALGRGVSVAAPVLRTMTAPKEYAGGRAVKGGLEAVKKLVTPKVEGYLHHTAINPNPLVGTRYETRDLGGLLPVKPISIEDLRGGMVNVNPWDLTSRNVEISGVSGRKLLNPVVTHGGQGYARDIAHQEKGIAGASGKEIASRVQNRANVAAQEAEDLGGSGRVYTLPSTMGVRSENFAFPTTELYYDLYKQADLPKSVIKQQSDVIRAIPGDKKTFPFASMPDLNHPEIMDLFERNPEFRKAFLAQQQSKAGQKMLNVNEEDIAAAMTDPNLLGVPRGYAGHTVIEMKPGAEIIPSKNVSYPYDTQGVYGGSLEHTPVPVLLNRPYERIYQEIRAKYPDKSDAAIRSMTIGALETRSRGISELIDEEAINRIGQYHEGAKQGKFDPFDIRSGLEYIRQPGIYKEGGSTTPAWQRKEGKNPEGGLNAKGRASYNRETGGNLKPPVSAEQAKKSPKSAARRKSFCARMSGNKGPMKDENGKPTRKALALKKWDC